MSDKPRNSRAFTIFAFGFALIVILYLYTEFAFQMRIKNFYTQNESRMIETLASSDSFDGLEALDWVRMFGTPVGPWVALMYADSHNGSIESVALARDSNGNWYHSKYHFCTAFSGYIGRRESIRKVQEGVDGWSFDEESDQEYIDDYQSALKSKPWWALDHATTEAEMREVLLDNHFVPYEP